jgi:transposase InsO family protein
MMDIREQIALMALSEEYTIAEIADLFSVSRPTVYKYRDRYDDGGRAALVDRSRAPNHPRRTSDSVRARILRERRRFGFGSKKLRRRMIDEDPLGAWPARSTIDAILKDAGLVKPRRRRVRHSWPFRTRFEASHPGELSTIDFKGEFRLRNGRWCYPLTMADSVSRYLLACQALPSIELAGAWPVVERVFREHGLPSAVLSDNGPPFGGHGMGRLSSFSVRLIELGIQPVFIHPGHPEENGSHERMHRTLKERLAEHRGRTMTDQQNICDRFRHDYNYERPHEGIDLDRPAKRHRPSPRPFPSKPPEIEYPDHFEVVRVLSNGAIKRDGEWIFISKALINRCIGLETDAEGHCNVHFGRFLIGRIDRNERRFV